MESALNQFEFHGFSPSQDLRRVASRMLYDVLMKSPVDTCLKAIVQKTAKGYSAFIRLASSGMGICTAVDEALDPIKAIQSITSRINEELIQWKEERFNPE